MKVSEKKRESIRRWRKVNPDKINEYARRYRAANREKLRAYHCARKRIELGVPDATRPSPELCECCEKYADKALRIDHDHATGKFRGWLCDGCNIGLGQLGDTREGVAKALAYLERAQ